MTGVTAHYIVAAPFATGWVSSKYTCWVHPHPNIIGYSVQRLSRKGVESKWIQNGKAKITTEWSK